MYHRLQFWICCPVMEIIFTFLALELCYSEIQHLATPILVKKESCDWTFYQCCCLLPVYFFSSLNDKWQAYWETESWFGLWSFIIVPFSHSHFRHNHLWPQPTITVLASSLLNVGNLFLSIQMLSQQHIRVGCWGLNQVLNFVPWESLAILTTSLFLTLIFCLAWFASFRIYSQLYSPSSYCYILGRYGSSFAV